MSITSISGGASNLQSLFKKLDTNSDGSVTKSEFVNGRPSDLSSDQASGLFDALTSALASSSSTDSTSTSSTSSDSTSGLSESDLATAFQLMNQQMQATLISAQSDETSATSEASTTSTAANRPPPPPPQTSSSDSDTTDSDSKTIAAELEKILAALTSSTSAASTTSTTASNTESSSDTTTAETQVQGFASKLAQEMVRAIEFYARNGTASVSSANSVSV
ncbi:EF-hand domain-containing protein [Magnetospirillum molischianum]|uniref:EF-hand domain-containing protein n=1 Tax=Magnetospirillum molischianum DSM 120 TaxID=1150626 RepID=H8FU15_MAGML|nr:EF-hand domain-containing protein [Magnetospirillum molischianum]CCG41853.1 hypothetical protein PHAMO_30009 [Magnetospirillum molischianum DSM 120]